MIQYPTNVSPQNTAIDATNTADTHITFTSNADYLSYVRYRIFEYDTGKMVVNKINYKTDFLPLGYNGYKISTSFGNDVLANGKDYILQMMLCQRTADGTEFLYDMPVLGGVVTGSSARNKIYVAENITSIYPWGYTSGLYYPCSPIGDSMIVKINGESHVIKYYNPQVTVDDKVYGMIETVDSFSFDVTDSMNYEIYSNFVISPQYFFRCRSKPSVSFTHNSYSNRLYVKGTYSQAQNSMIKYYVLKLYWSNTSSFVDYPNSVGQRTELVAETNKIYSQNIEYNFWNCYRHDSNYAHGTNDYYKVVCEIVTQDDMVYTSDGYVITLTPADYSGLAGNTLYSYDISWDKKMGRVIHALRGYGSTGSFGIGKNYELFRTDLDNNETVMLEPHFFEINEDTIYGCDMTASTHGNYKYELFLFDNTTGHKGAVVIPDVDSGYTGIGNFPCNIIKTSECAYYITDLTMLDDEDLLYHPNESGTKKPRFSTGDTWKFVGDIQDTTVTNNLDRMTHVGYGRYISSTSTDVNYMSGTLSAMIGYVNCTTREYVDNIALVRAWRKFITQKKSFLLKSQKGDVWVVNVTDNPTTQYQENYHKIPTTFSFSWAESYNINDISIVDVTDNTSTVDVSVYDVNE